MCGTRRLAIAAVLSMTLGGLAASPADAVAVDGEGGRLYLVTLAGPGLAGSTSPLPNALFETGLIASQDEALAAVGAPPPVYRWTTALNGFAVRLTSAQADEIAALSSVSLVEPNTVRPLAATPGPAAGLGVRGPSHGGAGVVIGVIDTGIAPASPLFAQLGHTDDTDYDGTCEAADSWDSAECNGKIVGASWFVDGFGEDAVRATTAFSARDTDGHGTQMASIAAGNAGVPVRVGGEPLGRFGGMAPDAQIAVYKACWSAPDPSDDGCATADLVTAIDQATRDGVDVLSLSVGGPSDIDTVERALLGAAEDDIVVAAAAGNSGDRLYAAHPGPWVTTVGGTVGDTPRGRVVVRGGPRLTGAMLSRREVGPSRVVLAAQAPAAGVSRSDARVCAPGSLDAAVVAGAVVICERGQVGRVDKSEAVALADGAGMALVNVARGSVDTDVHSIPTVHLSEQAGHALVRFVTRHPDALVRLRPAGPLDRRPRVAAWSTGGDAGSDILKPDVLAPAIGVLGAVPGGADDGWDFVSGTSAATAYTSGVAAALLGHRGWSATAVRSSLATTAASVSGGSALRTGAGRLRPSRVGSPGLVYAVDRFDYRDWLDGGRQRLNTPSLVLNNGETSGKRTITNFGRRRLYFSSGASGFRRDVLVTPAAVRLAPGESATFTVTVAPRRGGQLDDGYVVWRGARGSVTRIPVVVAR